MTTIPEIQQYQALHAQLVKTVLELLLDKSGPTSEYFSQSVIDIIQATQPYQF
ncbi:dynamin GTPase [Puccinia sorghi]|uniref:Dynamin GTPase n=1 Tax=Puccinia sorghi TaxID=27349 RepID=A0A0L6VD72_9BASI|nr:dynamin GTPase [Puccinia sorghi]